MTILVIERRNLPHRTGSWSTLNAKGIQIAMQSARKIFWIMVVLLVWGPIGVGRAETVTVVDCMGRRVEVRLPVRRLVALNSDIVEVVRTLKAQTCIVGVFSQIQREAEFWGDLARLPKVGSWRDPDPEAVAALAPDLVVAYGRNPGRAFEDKAAALGFQVLRLNLYQVDTLEREVRLLGRLLDRKAEAERFCAWHHRHLSMIASRLKKAPGRPAVYVESYSDYHAAGPGSGGSRMCVFSGGRNIAADLKIVYPRITPEWVVSQNPEVIIKAASYGNGYSQSDAGIFNKRRDAILARPAWHHISAVARRRVHVMDADIWTGPRAIIGMAYICRWLHPALFQDLDPEALHREYLETFQGVPYKGVYVSESTGQE
jgi:iron complex transport system substrate-binding protein